jgi:tol-pal system protein YbgF
LVPSSETSKVEQETPSVSPSAQAEAVTPAIESEESPRPHVSQSSERPDKLEYERLLALFRDGDLDGARQGFAAFLRDHENSDLSPNARYWLGEAHYGKKDYKQAIDSYDRVELDFPQSEKVPAAILKKGYAYLAMKDKKRASSAFKQVVTLYPRTPEAGKASDKLSQLKESR